MSTRTKGSNKMAKFGYKIYGLFDPVSQELRYIGKTQSRLSERLAHHIWRAEHEKSNTHKKQWILNLKRQNKKPEIVLLETCNSNSELTDAEVFHIQYWKFLGCRLVNHTNGGEGCFGYKHTTESKQKMSVIKKNKPSHMAGKKHKIDTKIDIITAKTKLSREDVFAIKQKYFDGVGSCKLSKDFSVRRNTILTIARIFNIVKKTWRNKCQ